MGTKTESRSHHHRAAWALAAITLVVPTAVVPPPTAWAVAVDPDAAAGLDDVDWVPPPGSVMSSGGGREIVPPSRSVKGSSTTQSSETTGVVEPQYTYCIDEKPEDGQKVDAVGCWWVSKLGGGENDPSADYYFHEFLVNGMAENGRNLHRVKGRNASGNGESVRWSPGADENHGDPADVTVGVSVGYGGASGGVSRTFRMYPGRLHPYAAGRSVYHSSWIANGSGAKSGVPSRQPQSTCGRFPRARG